MSGNDEHAGPDGVANDTRPSLSEGRRLYEAAMSNPRTEFGHWADWYAVQSPALLSLAEAVANAGTHHGVEDSCLYCDRVRTAAERFRP